MRLASEADFVNGPMYSQYQHFPFHQERAEAINELYPEGTILVVGCAWGYVVQDLLALGRNVWGIEASHWAVSMAYVKVDGEAARRVVFGDATQSSSMDYAAAQASVGRFDVAVTDDILPVLTDGEIQKCVDECRRIAKNVIHCVTPKPNDPVELDLNWKTIEEWRALLTPDPVRDEETGQVG